MEPLLRRRAVCALALLIRAKRPVTRPMFFETWGRKDGDAANCKEVPAICSYEGMQERLSKNYAELARRNSALLAPVGRAWSRVRKEHPEIELYAAIFRKSAAGAHAGGLGKAETAILEEAADAAALKP